MRSKYTDNRGGGRVGGGRGGKIKDKARDVQKKKKNEDSRTGVRAGGGRGGDRSRKAGGPESGRLTRVQRSLSPYRAVEKDM